MLVNYSWCSYPGCQAGMRDIIDLLLYSYNENLFGISQRKLDNKVMKIQVKTRKTRLKRSTLKMNVSETN